MKNKNAFTLVELIAVITLLAAILLVSVPTVINTIRKNEERKYQNFNDAIIRAAELYVERNRDNYTTLSSSGSTIDIDTETLIAEDYLSGDLKDPNNKSVSEYKVTVTVQSDKRLNYIVKEK